MIFLIDKNFLREILFKIQIKKIKELIIVKDIDSIIYFMNDYCIFNVYIFNVFKKRKLINHIHKKIHIINNFKIKILINIDIFEFKYININMIEKKLLIKNYNNLIINIKIKTKNHVDVRKIIRN